jgi:hypothetical protein
MDEQTVEKFAAGLKGVVTHFNALSELSMSIPDEPERQALRSALGRLMVGLDADVIRPLARQYPHLDPVEDKGP